MTASHQRKLEDWKIRAGLYKTHHAPLELDYTTDALIDSGHYEARCRDALQELKPYTRGLLKAPTPQLRRDAIRVNRANLTYLRACVTGHVVAWHHAKAAWEVAATAADTDYARALGANPTADDAPNVFH